MLVVPFGSRRLLGVVVDLAESSEVPEERLVEPLAALDGHVPPELVELGLWVAEQYCSTPARGLSLVLPPGTGTGAGRRVGPRRSLVAELTTTVARRSGAMATGRSGAPARRPARPRRRADGGVCARALGRLRPRHAAPARAARPREHRPGGAPRPRAARGGGGGPLGRSQGAHSGPAARARRCGRADGRGRRAACCSTASPAAARPRSTCARRPRRSRAGARRSCWCPRSRSRRRRPGASWSASATPWR